MSAHIVESMQNNPRLNNAQLLRADEEFLPTLGLPSTTAGAIARETESAWAPPVLYAFHLLGLPSKATV